MLSACSRRLPATSSACCGEIPISAISALARASVGETSSKRPSPSGRMIPSSSARSSSAGSLEPQRSASSSAVMTSGSRSPNGARSARVKRSAAALEPRRRAAAGSARG